MSFRQYGGINYAARNNIVRNNYSNANNLSIMAKVGQPASYINFESDISGNTIYGPYIFQGDVDISGNLTVSGTTTLNSDLTVSDDALINGLTVGIGSGTGDNRSTALGFQALSTSNDGFNTAVGYQSLNITTGDSNTAVGYQSLKSNISGYGNTALGSGTLNSNDAGNSNTAIGVNAGTNNIGSSNTFIGANTNTNSSSISYSTSTAIGAGAVITTSNQIVLGGNNGSGYPNVYIPGTFTVTGATALNSTLNVTGATTLSTNGTIASFNLIPAGMIMAGVSLTQPAGWLLCNGAAYSRTTYSILFAAINTSFGAGDGSTTFNVPNYTAAFLRGIGSAGSNHSSAVNFGTAQEDNVKLHTHTITDNGHAHDIYYSSTSRGSSASTTITGIGPSGLEANTTVASNTTGIIINNNTGSAENLVYNFAVNYFIKY